MIIKEFRPSIAEISPLIEGLISSGKKVKLAVTGYSMCPLLINERDSVILEKAENIKKYDIVLFKRKSGKYVLHRVIKVKDGFFAIAGDNETKSEYPVEDKEAVAKVCSYERNGIAHSVDEKWFKAYSRLWLWVFPFRRIITKLFFSSQRNIIDE